MLTGIGRGIIFTAAYCAGALCADALAQQSAPAGTDVEATTAVDEEIVVRGRTRAALRVQIRQAEDAFYERFNEINSDDDFDIHCRQEPVIGSRLPRRICQPDLWRQALTDIGRDTVLAWQGSQAPPPGAHFGRALHKGRLLDAEMRRLMTEDPQLRRLLIRISTLEQALDADTLRASSPASTFSQEITAGDASLPYGAKRMTEVRIGREPWRHELSYGTFTIAQLYGEIGALELDCNGRARPLTWALGVEWTLPEDRESCTLIIEAPPGTSFTLYEFE
ncbi:MAG: hypothetical protein JXB36_12260 [Gammaproteobacteria bacterium]|nr:hypothetical protein [Gammaproteobacteria bacterium]